MKRILVLVEGQTEERFIKDLLAPHLHNFDVSIQPTIITTKRTKIGKKFKGGIVSYSKVRKEILLLLKDRNAKIITTMFDFYALPEDFPGRLEAWGNPYQKVEHIENRFQSDIDHPRFFCFLTLHEFEGLLFTSPAEIARTLNEPCHPPR